MYKWEVRRLRKMKSLSASKKDRVEKYTKLILQQKADMKHYNKEYAILEKTLVEKLNELGHRIKGVNSRLAKADVKFAPDNLETLNARIKFTDEAILSSRRVITPDEEFARFKLIAAYATKKLFVVGLATLGLAVVATILGLVFRALE